MAGIGQEEFAHETHEKARKEETHESNLLSAIAFFCVFRGLISSATDLP
jgi:hypothetical protein